MFAPIHMTRRIHVGLYIWRLIGNYMPTCTDTIGSIDCIDVLKQWGPLQTCPEQCVQPTCTPGFKAVLGTMAPLTTYKEQLTTTRRKAKNSGIVM